MVLEDPEFFLGEGFLFYLCKHTGGALQTKQQVTWALLTVGFGYLELMLLLAN